MEYKNILWIDDCDTKDAGDIEGDPLEDNDDEDNSDEDIIKDYFYDLSNEVRLIKEYGKALTELQEKHTEYDLVIFDMNMQEGMDEGFDKIKRRLAEKNVLVPEKNFEGFKEEAGIYLYLFLLNCGYPNNRMVILTGYEKKVPQELLEKAFINPNKYNLVEKQRGGKIDPENKDWIKQYYKDDYYRVRKMVYKACEYWKEELREKNSEDIVFNTIYFGKDKEQDQKIERDSFLNMLVRIKLLFPVVKPHDCESLYYHALQVTTMFHEESANLTKVDDKEHLKKYHQSVRNFRNWSAHNKFIYSKIELNLFAYLFCIALRSYFVNEEIQFSTDADCYSVYEKDFFDSINVEAVDYNTFDEKYRKDWERHFKKVKNSNNSKKKLCWECKDVHELLLASGKCYNKNSSDKMKLVDCLFNLLGDYIVKTEELNGDNDYEYIIRYAYKRKKMINKVTVDSMMIDTFFEGWAVRLYLLS